METLFLACFLFGLLMVLASVLIGFAHVALPGGHDGFQLGSDHGHGDGHGAGHGHGEQALPLWNVSSVLAFLMWFGAAGYVATRFAGLTAWLALIPAVLFGVVGGLLVSAFLRLVLRGETELDPAQYRMEGTLARVSVRIPEGGTGEIIFTKGDRRRSEGARSVDGRPIARGEEVVVIDYQHGIALVQGWEDFKRDEVGVRHAPSLPAEGSSREAGTV